MMYITKEEKKILDLYITSKMLGEPFDKPPGIEHERLSDIIFLYECGENIVTSGIGEITRVDDKDKKGYVFEKIYINGKELEMEREIPEIKVMISKNINDKEFIQILENTEKHASIYCQDFETYIRGYNLFENKKVKIFPEVDHIFLEGEIYAINFLMKIQKELEEINDFILSDLENSIECEMRDIKFKFADRWVNHFFEKDGKQ